jgi:hypothetical protein
MIILEIWRKPTQAECMLIKLFESEELLVFIGEINDEIGDPADRGERLYRLRRFLFCSHRETTDS